MGTEKTVGTGKSVDEILSHLIFDAKGAARQALENMKALIEGGDEEARRRVLELWEQTKATCKIWESVIRYGLDDDIADRVAEEIEAGNVTLGTETGS